MLVKISSSRCPVTLERGPRILRVLSPRRQVGPGALVYNAHTQYLTAVVQHEGDELAQQFILTCNRFQLTYLAVEAASPDLLDMFGEGGGSGGEGRGICGKATFLASLAFPLVFALR